MLAESDINELLKDRYLEPIKQISKEVEENKRLILNEFLKSYNSKTKDRRQASKN